MKPMQDARGFGVSNTGNRKRKLNNEREAIMKTRTNQNTENRNHKANVNNTAKNQWIQTYSEKMLKAWKTWQGALGIADGYIEQIKEDLSTLYDNALERSFIESTY
ncbi:MAG: hypothetical protein ACYTGA_13910 [Planctomycetota bacterium]|jgi:hypothetical protein